MEQTEQERELWHTAKKRVKFKRHLVTYIVINGMLWLLWWVGDDEPGNYNVPWPVFSTIGWGIGLVFSFLGAYGSSGQKSAVQREYEKLKSKQ